MGEEDDIVEAGFPAGAGGAGRATKIIVFIYYFKKPFVVK